jgi:transcriptional regulator with GAF, ATPase, and Fis domain
VIKPPSHRIAARSSAFRSSRTFQIAEAQGRAERLETRVQMFADELDSKTRARVVGESAEWTDVLKKATTQAAATDTTVLLTGE